MSAIKDFVSNIFSAVSENLILGGAYYLIAKAVAVTAVITVLAWLAAAFFGILISYLMCYEKKIVSNIARAVCFIFRSIPVLLIVWLLYYCFFGGSTLSGVIILGLGIGLWGGGHLAEIIAHAVKEEQERLNRNVRNRLQKVYYSLVVPQALEDSMFQVKRLAVHLLQWTTIAGYIGVNDLTEVMYGIGQRTMYPFFSIFFSAVLYLLATIVIEWVYGMLERHVKEVNGHNDVRDDRNVNKSVRKNTEAEPVQDKKTRSEATVTEKKRRDGVEVHPAVVKHSSERKNSENAENGQNVKAGQSVKPGQNAGNVQNRHDINDRQRSKKKK